MVFTDSCHPMHGITGYQEILVNCYKESSEIATNGWGFLSESSDEFLLNLKDATLKRCLQEYAKARSSIHPSIKQTVAFCIYHLTRLEKALNVTLRSDQVTSIFYNRFIMYLGENGLSISSIEMLCNSLRTALSWAAKFQAKVHPSYTDIDLPKHFKQQLALTADEISMIYHFDLSKLPCRPQLKKTLDDVRNMFVLSANLGQRHSDMVRIGRGDFEDGKFRIVQQKTKRKAVVDIARMALDKKTVYEILERYNYEAPYKGDKSNYSRHIHTLMHFIFGEDMVEPTVIQGDLKKNIKIPKYKYISSHTCRRTFASHNYIVRNYPARIVMKATGHAEEKSFKAYICYDDEA